MTTMPQRIADLQAQAEELAQLIVLLAEQIAALHPLTLGGGPGIEGTTARYGWLDEIKTRAQAIRGVVRPQQPR